MKTIATVTALYSNDMFIKPHFSCITGVDKRFALIGKTPWESHSTEHGVVAKPEPLKHLKDFPDVEILTTDLTIDSGGDMVPFYSQFAQIAKDYDYVARFDSDMFFTAYDWNYLLNFVKTHDYDFYKMNFATNTINYYVDYEHGIKDGNEHDIMIFKTNKQLVSMSQGNGTEYMIEWPGWMCHHFRGWNKPNTTKEFWESEHYKNYSESGEYVVPLEIRDKFV